MNERLSFRSVGPDGTPGTYFTANTTDLMGQSFIGRYARYRAILSGDGTVTPTLKRVEFGYSGSLPSQYRTFSFDPAGNITEKKIAGDSSSVTETRTYNDLNQLTQNVIDDGTTPVTWTYTHDTNGNMTSKTDGTDTYTYVWNVDNQLEEVKLNAVTLVEYVYDSGSRLIQRTENGTTTNYTWSGWDLVREDKTGAITETTKYLVPEGEVLAFERDGEMFYLHGDALSSTQLITDENGDQVARFVYGAWGEELHAVDNVPGGTECRFVGGLGVRTDPVTGLIYMRHRWYSVEEQRFISRDPIGLIGGANPYKYAGGRPSDLIDPMGMFPWVALMIVGAAIGAGYRAYKAWNAGKSGGDIATQALVGVAEGGLAVGIAYEVAALSVPVASGFLIRAGYSQFAMAGAGAMGLSVLGGPASRPCPPNDKSVAFLKDVPGIRSTRYPKSLVQASRVPTGKPDKSGYRYTRAGHAFTKHANNQRKGTSPYPPLTGDNRNHNRTADRVVKQVLSNPDFIYFGRHGSMLEVEMSTSKGPWKLRWHFRQGEYTFSGWL